MTDFFIKNFYACNLWDFKSIEHHFNPLSVIRSLGRGKPPNMTVRPDKGRINETKSAQDLGNRLFFNIFARTWMPVHLRQ